MTDYCIKIRIQCACICTPSSAYSFALLLSVRGKIIVREFFSLLLTRNYKNLEKQHNTAMFYIFIITLGEDNGRNSAHL